MCLSYSTLAFFICISSSSCFLLYCIESIFSFSLPNDFDIEIYGEKERTTYGNAKHYGFDYVCPHNGALIYISSQCCSYCWWYFKLFVSRQDHFSTFFFSLSFILNLLFYFVFFQLIMTSISIIKSASSLLICIQIFRTAAFYCCPTLQMNFLSLSAFTCCSLCVKQYISCRLTSDTAWLWSSKIKRTWVLYFQENMKTVH